ncbi:hypothetical protein [Campylobacter sp. 1569]|uniref:hypothetical protein n=1 Tax=Campylobacter sp. 1569 TaxID=2735746 RepID=UPI00301CFEF9|nr:hypothetical protein [Campylobacter sp. 1569]
MTAYVHIGTVKTGTTSIQQFLHNNNELLLKQNMLYVKSFRKYVIQHWKIADFISFCVENNYSNIQDIQDEYWKNEIHCMQEELVRYKNTNFLFSSEGITRTFFTTNYIKCFKNILSDLGFKKIYIIVYFRDLIDFIPSFCSQTIKAGILHEIDTIDVDKYLLKFVFDYKWICYEYSKIFGKENLIVRLFDQNEFYCKNLYKDFIYSIGLKWDNKFKIPSNQNKSLDLLGIELQRRFNRIFSNTYFNYYIRREKTINLNRLFLLNLVEKYFSNSQDKNLKFCFPEEKFQYYIDYFEESNEWVRKEFFPHKERLFPKKDLSGYKENYELKEMKPEYWDKIADFIAEIIKVKNDVIIEQMAQVKILSDKLDFIKSKDIFNFKYGSARVRIQNQLTYKLGQAIVINSKSLLGYIRMPFVLSYIKEKHKQEQKKYKEKIKKDPSLVLPSLDQYPDYQEAIDIKKTFSYKLGQAFIRANSKRCWGGVYQIAI